MKLKRKIPNVQILAVLIISFISGSSFGQTQNKNLLIGKWLFVTFELPKSSPTNAEYIFENNKKYKDVIYVFTKSNEFKMQKKSGSKNFNKQTTYKLTKDNRYIQFAVGQKMRIDYLDAHTLKIFVEGFQPTGIFKRIE